jgi:hypothetical protein
MSKPGGAIIIVEIAKLQVSILVFYLFYAQKGKSGCNISNWGELNHRGVYNTVAQLQKRIGALDMRLAAKKSRLNEVSKAC